MENGPDLSPLLELLDHWFPQFHPWSSLATACIVPAIMWLVGFRWHWREDRRKDDQSVVVLAMQLVGQQREELGRLTAQGDGLRHQIALLSEGRYRLQDAIDAIRDQTIGARVMIHDYERRLGIPETQFPQLPIPVFAGDARPAADRALTGS